MPIPFYKYIKLQSFLSKQCYLQLHPSQELVYCLISAKDVLVLNAHGSYNYVTQFRIVSKFLALSNRRIQYRLRSNKIELATETESCTIILPATWDIRTVYAFFRREYWVGIPNKIDGRKPMDTREPMTWDFSGDNPKLLITECNEVNELHNSYY